MSRLANWLVRMAEGWARRRSNAGFPSEPDLVIGPRGPRLKYVKPTTTDERGWDSRHYERGNIHLEGYHNPVQIVPKETEEVETGTAADGGHESEVGVEQLNEVGVLPSTNFKTALVGNDAIPKGLNPEPFADMLLYIKATAVLAGIAAVASFVAGSAAL